MARGGVSLGDLNGTLNFPFGIALDVAAGKMYVANFGNNTVSQANLDGTGGVSLGNLADTLDRPTGIALDVAAGKMYVANAGNNTVSQANLDGTGGVSLGNLNSTLNGPMGIALGLAQGHTLTVNKAGTGTGTVTSDPAGINCGADCTNGYNEDTDVTLTAIPDADSAFTGWSGDCSGADPTITVTMDDDKTCTATFTSYTLIVTVNTDGAGEGTVTSQPAGINCGADCTENYAPATVVTLTAHLGVKSYLASWSGDCVSTGALTAQVTLDDDRTCTVTFGYPVGGIVVPVGKLGLVAPWMGLVALAGLAALGVVLVRRRRG
jgi:uncharacterized repeat protein (TIGR02543 family)